MAMGTNGNGSTNDGKTIPNILIGASGWSYPEWKGIVYPENLPQNKFFDYYSEFFYTAEINSTFYQIPSYRTAEIWAEKAPHNFIYSAKIPDLVTHKGKMDFDQILEPFTLFIKNMVPLIRENKLLALLLQLPPKFGIKKDKDQRKLQKFFDHWNNTVIEQIQDLQMEYREYHHEKNDKVDDNHNVSDTYSNFIVPKLVVEFRNKNWFENDTTKEHTFDLLKNNDVSYCAVVEPLLEPYLEVTSPSLFYLRFHGFGKKPWFNYNFKKEELNAWVEKLTPLFHKYRITSTNLNDNKRAVLYFNNHFSGYAVKNAIYLAKQSNIPIKRDDKDLKRPINQLKTGIKQKMIDDFFN